MEPERGLLDELLEEEEEMKNLFQNSPIFDEEQTVSKVK